MLELKCGLASANTDFSAQTKKIPLLLQHLLRANFRQIHKCCFLHYEEMPILSIILRLLGIISGTQTPRVSNYWWKAFHHNVIHHLIVEAFVRKYELRLMHGNNKQFTGFLRLKINFYVFFIFLLHTCSQ